MKKIKIFGTPWHLAHNHDLMMALKPFADFYLLINYTRRWSERMRPLPEHAHWVTHFEKGKYDLAILHIDQQCANLDLNKSVLIRDMKQTIKKHEPKLPIVFINHGTPVYPEMTRNGQRIYTDASPETKWTSEILRKEILEVIGDDHMVVNSHQARKDWGKGHTIVHGLDADEWIYTENKEPIVSCFISEAGIGDKYYNRNFLRAVMENLYEVYGIRLQWINTSGCFNARDIREYKEFIGKSLVYFNPTYASPMPRSRTEAMLSGCCVVTTPYHDADQFIQEGVNGFLVKDGDVKYASALISRLLENYKLAKEVGKMGRQTALELFSRERYRKDWVAYLKELKILQ